MLDYAEISRLVEDAAKLKVGKNNIVRAFTEPGVDSEHRDALKITIVIAPGATDRIKGDQLLDMLLEINNKLYEKDDSRTPIVSYATEEEIAAGDDPEC